MSGPIDGEIKSISKNSSWKFGKVFCCFCIQANLFLGGGQTTPFREILKFSFSSQKTTYKWVVSIVFINSVAAKAPEFTHLKIHVRKLTEEHESPQNGLMSTDGLPQLMPSNIKANSWGKCVYKWMVEKGNLGDREWEIQFDCNLMYTFYCLWVKLDFRFVFSVPPICPLQY